MTAHRHLPWALAATMLVLGGCTVRASTGARYGGTATIAVSTEAPREVYVASPPPPLRAEAVIAAQPGPDAVWVPGHYEWNGTWTWVPGRWVRNRAGYAWVPPVAHQEGGRIVYYGGYWRRADAQPPPVYARPGLPVAVVRPAQPPPAGRVPATPGPGRAPAQPPPAGRVPATPGPGRAPATPGTATPARPAPGGPATVVRPGDRVTQPAQPPPQGPATVVRPEDRIETRPAPDRPSTAPAPNVPATQPNPRVPDPGRVVVQLSCRIDVPRAPAGGLVTINGSGFTQQAQVTIAGRGAAIVSVRPNQIQARVPSTAGGGPVRITQGGESANCGTISISGR